MAALITVSLVRDQTTRDKYNDTTETWTITEVPYCQYAPRSSEERVNATEPAVLTGGTLYMPPGSPAPGANDVIALPPGTVDDGGNPIPGAQLDEDGQPVYNGPTYAVQGDAGVWPGVGIEVAVQRWSQP